MARLRRTNNNTNGTMTAETENRSRFEFNKEPDRVEHVQDTRSRVDLYEFPDFDNLDYSDLKSRNMQLVAPPAQVDPKYGKLRQFWANIEMNNGHRIQELKNMGYRVRDPKTVPSAFRSMTEQWQGHDVIMVANRHILMEIPEVIYKKYENKRLEENRRRINDIQNKHGNIMRDGQWQEEKLQNAGAFSKEVTVNRNDSDGINFAD